MAIPFINFRDEMFERATNTSLYVHFLSWYIRHFTFALPKITAQKISGAKMDESLVWRGA
jgi:hypothetical protein